ncbi:pentapeptide repeat-containing protein [Tolypothrix bouteillei VB521301_2]|uniref:pentapeptide repeat-containing protein n=1 Tax=Tolypothrix bouteillei TaxID=1246981 RepID=UPI0038B4450E
MAYKFAAELGALAEDFTELARSHINNDAAPVDYTWSSYLRRQISEFGDIVPSAPLRKFEPESLEKLRKTFGRAPLTKAVIDLLLPMLDDCHWLINIVEATRGKTEAEVGYIGGNSVTLLVRIDKAALEGKDFSCAVIKGADFSNASLCRTNFAEANLADSIFTKRFGLVLSVAYGPDAQVFATR